VLPSPSAYYAQAQDDPELEDRLATLGAVAHTEPIQRLPFQTYSNGFIMPPRYRDKEARGCRKVNSKLSKVAELYKTILSHQSSAGRQGNKGRPWHLDLSQDLNDGAQMGSGEDTATSYKFFDGVQNPLVLQQMNEMEQPSHGRQKQGQPPQPTRTKQVSQAQHSTSVQAPGGLENAVINVVSRQSPAAPSHGGPGDLKLAMRDRIRKFGQMFNDGAYTRMPGHDAKFGHGRGRDQEGFGRTRYRQSRISAMAQSQDLQPRGSTHDGRGMDFDTANSMPANSIEQSGSAGVRQELLSQMSDADAEPAASQGGQSQSKTTFSETSESQSKSGQDTFSQKSHRQSERTISKSALGAARGRPDGLPSRSDARHNEDQDSTPIDAARRSPDALQTEATQSPGTRNPAHHGERRTDYWQGQLGAGGQDQRDELTLREQTSPAADSGHNLGELRLALEARVPARAKPALLRAPPLSEPGLTSLAPWSQQR